MQITRRKFFKVCTGVMAGTSATMLGFAPTKAFAAPREYKLLRAKETRQTCTYCAVGCGMLMYSLGDGAKNVRSKLIHVEGDPDHPVSRGSLCPKGAGVMDFVNSPNRVLYPEYRAAGSDKWERISWHDALTRIARLLKDDRDANFQQTNAEGTTVNRWTTTGMLCASAASNETCWLTHKWGRALGMVVLDNQGSTCHGPTVASLAPSFGRGAMTNHWVDIKNADVVIAMGANPAEAHPVGFKWVIEAKKQNNATFMVIDPRFNRSAAVADHYITIRSGSDIAFLLGAIRWLLENDKIQHEYVRHYTNATFLVSNEFDFEDGLFSGYDPETRTYDKSKWVYQLDENGNPIRDMSMQDPRCVINLLRKHVERYTPKMVERITGISPKNQLLFCETIGATAVPDKTTSFLYALGWTQHTVGTQNIRSMAMIQLLLGNIGMAGGGVNALRGHSNVQGATDLGLYPHTLPSYLKLPQDKDRTLADFLARTTPKTLGEDQVNYWKNTPKFMVSLLKAFYGDNATADNEFGYQFLPKYDQRYDPDKYIDLMSQGKVTGYMCQGFNPVGSFPNKNKVIAALSKLKFLVIFDPIKTATSDFWQNHGEMNDVNPADIQTEVFRLPTTCFAEEDGSIANSGRWLQWHWKAVEQPYEAKPDVEILSELRAILLEMYRKEGGANFDALEAMQWNYMNPLEPTAEELAKENNGYALKDLYDKDGKLIAKKGQLLSSFGHLRDDGSTMAGCWIYTGQWTEQGNQMANRDNADPSGLGNTLGWSFAWPANRRILYNRASADLAGNPWNKDRQLVKWNGKNWNYIDIADFGTAPPNAKTMPFIMQPDGSGGIFGSNRIGDGPFPEHYEPWETPIGTNPLHPNVVQNPVARVLPDDRNSFGTAKEFPYVGTTYSLTELFHCWTGQAMLNVIAQPQQFAEIGEALAKEKGIKAGDWVKVTSKRGFIKAKAVVTKRLKDLQVNGQTVHQIGLPTHWSFSTVGQKGFLTNTLTPPVGDANTQTPEYKAFLVNIEKVEG
ncbi:formate dehydrogenase-N subunit alpha [Pasteurella atlantica]|uniref:formate dehydrogenase-N subunit alpha n=1 Tax=Pasteurellaceae TaxID=712 RepID=UPI00274CFF37|nr:formate dehydrogenase-N subunit alpha [Pasteurella atlantica]MDP8099025.1 formate dehydrogenase-N subunit alpha [Pasteurella atlantica]MDP8107052.1 formate dehydrogenase-N subunit alpha [Pasteurella atlantica]MDP8116742.1 formate dehydrogenase-N subunit alpha [Pasteurella atlantica]